MSWPRMQFEYKTIARGGWDQAALMRKLNALGLKGWEMVGVICPKAGYEGLTTIYLKRTLDPGHKWTKPNS